MSDLTPNEFGIWPEDHTECLLLPSLGKKQITPIARICLLETPHGWLSSADYHITGQAGGGYGLSEKWCDGFLPDRETAVQHALTYLHARFGCYPDHPDSRTFGKWASEALYAAPVQQDMFA